MKELEYLQKRQVEWDRLIDKKLEWVEEQRKHRLKTRDKSIPSIPEFYAGRTVLMTGGTGFIGKAIIEKMLRSLPDLDKIYVIVRTKKNKPPNERIASILNTELFDLVRKQSPGVTKKVIGIPGDMSLKGLGISPEDKVLLQNEVSVVIHGAASIRFDQPLRDACLLNARGTRDLVEMCKGMHQLKSFVYVSTTFVNTDQAKNQEKVYPTPYDWQYFIKMAETTSHEDLQALTHKFLGFQPNTYTFTKQLSEKIVDDARHQLPIVIMRPAVVVATAHEPFPSWTDNINGPVGFSIGAMKGVLRVIYVDGEVCLNVASVDAIAAILISSAWMRGTNQRMSDDPSATDVVNISAEDFCHINYRDYRMVLQAASETVLPKCLRAPRLDYTQNYLWFKYRVFTSHVLFSLVIDLVLKLSGQKTQLMKLSRAVYNVNTALRYFMVNNFYNCTDNLWKHTSYITDPEFIPEIRFNFVEASIGQSLYAYKNVVKQECGSLTRLKIFEVIHYIQQTIKYTIYLWLAWKMAKAVSHRYGYTWLDFASN